MIDVIILAKEVIHTSSHKIIGEMRMDIDAEN